MQLYAQTNVSNNEILDAIVELKIKITEVKGEIMALNSEIKRLDQRIDGLDRLLYVVLGGMFVLVGFVLWDRRSTISPIASKTQQLEERENMLERAFILLAKRDPKVSEVLTNVGLI